MTVKMNIPFSPPDITEAEIVEVITHLAFYVGWPKAWSAMNAAKTIYRA